MNKPLIKICGNRSLHDLSLTAASSADYLGLIFAKSKRRVQADQVKEWLQKVDLRGKKLAAVFVNAPNEEIESVLRELPIDVIQLHGSETPDQAGKIKRRFGAEVWKALPHKEDTLSLMRDYEDSADGFVIDSKVKETFGGTGESFDWSSVPAYIKAADEMNRKVFIAGGIGPDNIDGLLALTPGGIDLSSGIEQNERKDELLLRRFEERVNQHVSISG
ncbi:phosphoribosylanthranilate isomerase [Metabacillus sp. JX24]|uniref:phosphoribosylanthranilate isomerase n=1 Tax=Metabacillus sp. JX24 TaxID=3240759 RepID=UPI003510741E